MANRVQSVAVVGRIGAGKSAFIKHITGRDDIIIGRGLNAQTTECESYELEHEGVTYELIDTLGLNDPFRTDELAWQGLIWHAIRRNDRYLVSGLLFLHPVSVSAKLGFTLETQQVCRQLCGDDDLHNIVIATTFWEDEEQQWAGLSAEKREAAMQAKESKLFQESCFYGDLKRWGARTARVYDNRESCLRVMTMFVNCVGGLRSTLAQEKVASISVWSASLEVDTIQASTLPAPNAELAAHASALPVSIEEDTVGASAISLIDGEVAVGASGMPALIGEDSAGTLASPVPIASVAIEAPALSGSIEEGDTGDSVAPDSRHVAELEAQFVSFSRQGAASGATVSTPLNQAHVRPGKARESRAERDRDQIADSVKTTMDVQSGAEQPARQLRDRRNGRFLKGRLEQSAGIVKSKKTKRQADHVTRAETLEGAAGLAKEKPNSSVMEASLAAGSSTLVEAGAYVTEEQIPDKTHKQKSTAKRPRIIRAMTPRSMHRE